MAVYGPREAARQAQLPVGTVLSWCRRYKWKKADRIPRMTGINGMSDVVPRDAGDAISEALAQHREDSTLHLAKFTAKAAKQASKLNDPLSKARAVRDVAQVYRTLYPPEEGGELVEGAILVSSGMVKDDPVEMLAGTEAEIMDTEVVKVDDTNVRQEIPDQRPQSH